MNQNLGTILRSSPVGCDVCGIFAMSYLTIFMRPKSVWKPPKDHASLEVFLSRLEKKLFSDNISEATQSNLSDEEWKVLRGLAADKTVVIKGADKVS